MKEGQRDIWFFKVGWRVWLGVDRKVSFIGCALLGVLPITLRYRHSVQVLLVTHVNEALVEVVPV